MSRSASVTKLANWPWGTDFESETVYRHWHRNARARTSWCKRRVWQVWFDELLSDAGSKHLMPVGVASGVIERGGVAKTGLLDGWLTMIAGERCAHGASLTLDRSSGWFGLPVFTATGCCGDRAGSIAAPRGIG